MRKRNQDNYFPFFHFFSKCRHVAFHVRQMAKESIPGTAVFCALATNKLY